MPTCNKLELRVIFFFRLFFIDIFYHFDNAIIILITRFEEKRITRERKRKNGGHGRHGEDRLDGLRAQTIKRIEWTAKQRTF